MSSPHSQAPLTGSYDQSLLASAPAATKAAKQAGYNVDLLDERRVPPTTRTADLEAAHGGSKDYISPVEQQRAAPLAKPPFWRTRRGMMIIAVVAIIVVGAVVGGAVGGSVRNKNRSKNRHGGGTGGLVTSSSSNSTATTLVQPIGPQGQVQTPTQPSGGQQIQPTVPPQPLNPDIAKPTTSFGGNAISLPTETQALVTSAQE